VDVVDQHGVPVPDADNAVTFDVAGAGTYAGADSGKEDDPEGYQDTTHRAFNGKVLAIVQAADHPGPITITASAGGLLPTTTTVYSVNHEAHGLVAAEPEYLRSTLGNTPTLPPTVVGVYADGSTATLPVQWHQLPPGGLTKPGSFTVQGDLPGQTGVARAVVTVYALDSIEPYTTVTPVGDPPFLPAVVTLRYTDGVTESAPVTWDAVDPSRIAEPGSVTVPGTVSGTSVRAHADVTVTPSFTPDQNIARASSPTDPSTDAGYSGSPNAVPAGMQDGNTASGGWSNFYNKSATNTLPSVSLAHASEWVSVSWPSGQRIDSLVPYYTVSTNRMLPSAVQVSYWDGADWVPVTNQQVIFASASNQATTIAFDPVSTTSVRLRMTSPAPDTSTGFMQISELQVLADEITAPAP
jgi:beta-galactosidase